MNMYVCRVAVARAVARLTSNRTVRLKIPPKALKTFFTPPCLVLEGALRLL